VRSLRVGLIRTAAAAISGLLAVGVTAPVTGSPQRGMEPHRWRADQHRVSNATRATTLAAVALVAVVSGGPALAETPPSPTALDVPAVLDADLSATETQALSDLTTGSGVVVEAFVVTPDGAEVIALDAGSRADAAAAARLLEGQPSVSAANLAVPIRAVGGTSAEQYGNAMVRSELARAEVDGPLADVVVAVLDTGVAAHPELAGALVAGQNFTDSPGGASDATDRHGHGTHVAGTVGADEASTVEGVAHGVRIMPVKVLSDTGGGTSTWANQGILWAADNGADVINMSLGGTGASGVYAEAVAYARSKGVTVVAAAGNDASSVPFWPAAETGVIAVSAVDETRAQAWFSNYGSYVDVAAPGVGILSTDVSGGHSWKNGTSMASPHVAGVLALIEAAAPGLTPDQAEQALIAGVTDLGTAGRDDVFGYGLVDAVRAVQAANSLEDTGSLPADPPSTPGIGSPTPGNGAVRVRWSAPASDGGSPVTGYRVYTYRSGNLVGSTDVPAGATQTLVAGLTNGTAYRFGLRALNAMGLGDRSLLTSTVTPRTVAGAPKVGTPSAARSAAVVRWAAPVSTGGAAITGYVVRTYSGGKLVRSTSVSAAKRSFTVTKLTPGRAYTFRLQAKNVAGLGTYSVFTSTVKPKR
jgi:subtilisin family serine protease